MNSQQFSKLLAGIIICFLVVPPHSALKEKPDSKAARAVKYSTPASTLFEIKRVSIASDGTQGNNASGVFGNYVSGDGRFVVFGSLASNLVVGDSNNNMDVFIHDTLTGQTELVSVSSSGIQGNSFSGNAIAITKEGRYVAFSSNSNNLVADDINGHQDVFVRDRQTGVTQLVSVASDGTQGNSASGYSYVSISADGRYVAYDSGASNLVSNDTNGKDDVFVYDRQTSQTRRVSVSSDGTQGDNHSFILDISSDGRYVFFNSSATNLDPDHTSGLFLYDMQTAQITWVSSGGSSVSDDGRYIAFYSTASDLVPEDTNGVGDTFVFDRQNNVTTRVSVSSDGIQANAGADGGCGSSPSISGDGRYVVFLSPASNLVEGDTNGACDVFVHDNIQGTTTRVSLTADGSQSNGPNGDGGRIPTISDDGQVVAFSSQATNLVPEDTNEATDIFISRAVSPWTIMVYLDGDQDGTNGYESLDPNYLNVFNQLENAADNPNANIVVAWDRSSENGNNNSFYYKVEYDTNLNQLATTYEDGVNRWSKGELDMGNPTTLSDFIEWARTNYPAQHYALFISDHGTGLNGTAVDHTNNGDLLSVKELGDALSTATSNGGSKLDIVFVDSCLMGMIEDGYQIRNYANIYIASENLLWIPGSGAHPYSNYISSITASTTSQELATNILNEYASWLDNTYPGQYGYTLSAVDLTQIDPLVTAISNLSTGLQSHLPTYTTQVKSARDTAQKFDSNSNRVIVSSDEYVDLADLASELKQRISDTDIQNAAQDVTDAVNTYVIGNRSNSGSTVYPSTQLDPNCVHGVSIFFPTGDSKRSFYNGLNLDFASDAAWGSQQSSLSLSAASTTGWGSFLVEYVSTINPSAPDDPSPPDLATPLTIGEALSEANTYVSIASQDGHLFELLENSNTGWRFNTNSARFYVGDDQRNRQYLSILSFDTSSLPDDAIILSATLNVKRVRTIGTNPFDTHGNLLVEIGSPCFGNSCNLEISDFQADAQALAGNLSSASTDNWHSAVLDAAIYPYIDLTGTTQFRLRFEMEDNNDRGMDAIQFLSGNAPIDDRLQLIVEYTLP